ncbi:MAG: pilus assembly protein TadG-related protein [Asticcacaulis sp.]
MIGVFFTSWARNRGGNVTLMVSLAAIPVMLAGTGAMEMMAISSEHGRLQAAVDAAALSGANRLSVVTTSTLAMVTQAAQQAGTDNLGGGDPATFTATIDQTKNSVTVTGTAQHKAIIGFLGLGDTVVHATATADALQKTPLCVLQVDQGGIDLANTSVIRAPGCLIHADTNISVASSRHDHRRPHPGRRHRHRADVAQGQRRRDPHRRSVRRHEPQPDLGVQSQPQCRPRSRRDQQCRAHPQRHHGGAGRALPADPGRRNAHIHLQPGDHYFMGGLIMTKTRPSTATTWR